MPTFTRRRACHPRAGQSHPVQFCPAAVMLAGLLLATAAGPAPAQNANPNGEKPPAKRTFKQIVTDARDQAVKRIAVAAKSEDPELRMNAIEAMQPLPRRARPLAELGLSDQNPGVKFAALVTIGKLELESLGEAAKEHIDATDPSVRAAALFAAHECGLAVDISPLAKLAGSQNPSVRGNVVMLLGLMDDRSAKPMLKAVSKAPMPRASPARETVVRIQVGEALVRLGDEQALSPLRAAVFNRHLEARVLAVTVLGKLGDKKIAGALKPLLSKPPIELQLASAKALSRMAEPDEMQGALDGAMQVLMRGASMTEKRVRKQAKRFLSQSQRMEVNSQFKRLLKDKKLRQSVAANLRAQAAFGLGYAHRPKAAARLVKMLNNDPAARVQLAAAAAILEAAAKSPEPEAEQAHRDGGGG